VTPRERNVTLLDRQLLLERSQRPIPDALDAVAGLQVQYAPSGYVGLWTRLAAFERDALSRALADRTVVQGTLMRTTIHLVSARKYWLYALGVRQARRQWWLQQQRGRVTEAEMQRAADRLRDALSDGPRSVKELGDVVSGFLGNASLWVDILRVPPSATWERRRADVLALAERWIGPPDATEEEGLAHLVAAYLRGYGPAPWRDIASWAGVPVTPLRAASDGLGLVRLRDEEGRELVDLPSAAVASGDVRPPVRFLAHWDAALLVHARRTGVLPEEHRQRVFSSRNPFSVGTYLVGGRVAGGWAVRDARIVLDPYEPLGAEDEAAVEAERMALEAFHR
jgi:hypothetical protein